MDPKTIPSQATVPAPVRTPLREKMAVNLAIVASQPSHTSVFAAPRSVRSTTSAPTRHLITSYSAPISSQSSQTTSYPSSTPSKVSPTPRYESSFAPSSSSYHSDSDLHDAAPQLNSIYHFLENCPTSVTQFLECFIANGCSKEENLLTISSWTPAQIEEFLDRVSIGMHMTLMEKYALRNHFLGYFKGQ